MPRKLFKLYKRPGTDTGNSPDSPFCPRLMRSNWGRLKISKGVIPDKSFLERSSVLSLCKLARVVGIAPVSLFPESKLLLRFKILQIF